MVNKIYVVTEPARGTSVVAHGFGALIRYACELHGGPLPQHLTSEGKIVEFVAECTGDDVQVLEVTRELK